MCKPIGNYRILDWLCLEQSLNWNSSIARFLHSTKWHTLVQLWLFRSFVFVRSIVINENLCTNAITSFRSALQCLRNGMPRQGKKPLYTFCSAAKDQVTMFALRLTRSQIYRCACLVRNPDNFIFRWDSCTYHAQQINVIVHSFSIIHQMTAVTQKLATCVSLFSVTECIYKDTHTHTLSSHA